MPEPTTNEPRSLNIALPDDEVSSDDEGELHESQHLKDMKGNVQPTGSVSLSNKEISSVERERYLLRKLGLSFFLFGLINNGTNQTFSHI